MKKYINKLFEWFGYVPKINYKTINLAQEWQAFKLDGIANIDLIVETNTLRIPSDTLKSLGYEYAILCTKNACEVIMRINKDTNSKLSYDKLLEHYYFTLGLWCIDRNPNEVDIDWIRQNAFQPKPIDNDP